MIGITSESKICISVIRDGRTAHIRCINKNIMTNQLRDDIALEVTSTSNIAVVLPIDTIGLGSDGGDYDTNSLSPSDFTFDDSVPNMTIYKYVRVSTAYQLQIVRLYAGGKTYFQAYIYPPVIVNTNDIVAVSWTIQLKLITGSPPGGGSGILNGATASSTSFPAAIHHILGQDRGGRTLKAEVISAEQLSPPAVLLSVPTENDPVNSVVRVPPTNFANNGNLEAIFIRNSTSPYDIKILLSSPIPVTRANILKLEIYFR